MPAKFRLPTVRFFAGELHGFHGDSRPAAHAALSQTIRTEAFAGAIQDDIVDYMDMDPA